MATATETFTEIEKAAQKNAPTLRIVDAMKVGQVIRQGDIYIERIEQLTKERGEQTQITQLAIGQTQGSRHIIDPKPPTLVVFAPNKGASPLDGPFVVTEERWLLTHPEHGHFDMPPGVFRVRYQRDYARERAEEIRRVSD